MADYKFDADYGGSWIGGIRIGGFNATYPFATLTATREYIDLSVGILFLKKNYHFPKGEVAGVSIYNSFMPFSGRGVKIRHLKPGWKYATSYIFWNFNHRQVVTKLISLGYKVEAENKPWWAFKSTQK